MAGTGMRAIGLAYIGSGYSLSCPFPLPLPVALFHIRRSRSCHESLRLYICICIYTNRVNTLVYVYCPTSVRRRYTNHRKYTGLWAVELSPVYRRIHCAIKYLEDTFKPLPFWGILDLASTASKAVTEFRTYDDLAPLHFLSWIQNKALLAVWP